MKINMWLMKISLCFWLILCHSVSIMDMIEKDSKLKSSVRALKSLDNNFFKAYDNNKKKLEQLYWKRKNGFMKFLENGDKYSYYVTEDLVTYIERYTRALGYIKDHRLGKGAYFALIGDKKYQEGFYDTPQVKKKWDYVIMNKLIAYRNDIVEMYMLDKKLMNLDKEKDYIKLKKQSLKKKYQQIKSNLIKFNYIAYIKKFDAFLKLLSSKAKLNDDWVHEMYDYRN